MNIIQSVSDAIRIERSLLHRTHVRKFTPEPLPEETISRRRCRQQALNAGRRDQSSKQT